MFVFWRCARVLTDTPFFEVAGEAAVNAASGWRIRWRFTRTPKQVVDSTMRALSGRKPSFVDGTINALVCARTDPGGAHAADGGGVRPVGGRLSRR